MLEAMWTITFERPGVGSGAGVMVLETGRIFGGDTSFCFIGRYEVNRGTLIGKVHVSRHSDMMINLFGIDEFDLTLTGNADPHRMEFVASVDGAPQAKLRVTATRKCDLP